MLRRGLSDFYLAGGYGVYYYNNTAWDVVKPEPEPPGAARFQQLKETLSELPYWRMEPANQLAIGGLASPSPERSTPATRIVLAKGSSASSRRPPRPGPAGGRRSRSAAWARR